MFAPGCSIHSALVGQICSPMACPAATAAGALLTAMLVNGAVDMTGIAGYPVPQEGFGRVLLEDSLYFAGDSRGLVVQDVRSASGLSDAEARERANRVSSSTEPERGTFLFFFQFSCTSGELKEKQECPPLLRA